MIPSEVSDVQLVDFIKKENSNDAVIEAISRFSGYYVDICKKYTYVPSFEMNEILSNKNTNIYNYMLDYDSSRNMKVSTYIAQRVKWECMSKVDPVAAASSSSDDNQIRKELIDSYKYSESNFPTENKEIIETALSKMDNKQFVDIIKIRFLGERVLSWSEVGEEMGISHEWCRQVFNKHLKTLESLIKADLKRINISIHNL